MMLNDAKMTLNDAKINKNDAWELSDIGHLNHVLAWYTRTPPENENQTSYCCLLNLILLILKLIINNVYKQ